jgi:hypothetical protein
MARSLPVRLASVASLFASLAGASPASAQNEGPAVPPAPASGDARATGNDDAQTPSVPAPSAPAPPAAPTEAHETEPPRYPISRALRPLTLPKLHLAASLDLSSAAWTQGRFTNATVGAALGITDDLTVRAVVAPLQLTSPNAGTFGGVHYGETAGTQGPTLTATYRFLRGDVELGAFAGGQVLTAFNLSGYRLWAGVPLRAHVSKSVRVDVAPEVTFTHQTNEAIPAGGVALNPQGFIPVTDIGVLSPVAIVRTTDRYALYVPMDVTWSMTELFHAGMSTGYVAGDLSSVKDSSRIPLGIYGGYTVAGARGPVLDIDPYFDFPGLFRPGSSSQKTQTDWNEIGVTVRAHVDLL